MYELIVIFCSMSSSGYGACRSEPAATFVTMEGCRNFYRDAWKGEGYVVMYCAPKSQRRAR